MRKTKLFSDHRAKRNQLKKRQIKRIKILVNKRQQKKRYFSASFSSLMLSLWLIAQHSSFRLQVTRACLPLLSTRLIYDFSSMHKYLKPKTSVALAFNWLLMKRKLSDSLRARPRSQEWVEMHFYSIFPHWKKMRILFFFVSINIIIFFSSSDLIFA